MIFVALKNNLFPILNNFFSNKKKPFKGIRF